MANLIGQYHLANSILEKEEKPGFRLLIVSRKKPTPQKPKNYLLLKADQGKDTYISSLYPAPEWSENDLQTYFLDFRGLNYVLTIDRQKSVARISEKQGYNLPSNSTSSINNVELGVKFTPHGQI